MAETRHTVMLCIIIEWVVLRYKMMPIIVRVPIIIFNKDVKKTHSIKSSSLLLRQLQEPLEVMAIVSKKTIGASVPVHEYLQCGSSRGGRFCFGYPEGGLDSRAVLAPANNV